MKKCLILMLSMLLLAGCSEPKTFETMSDVYYEPELPDAQRIVLSLPEEAAANVMTDDAGGSLYLCDGYSIMVQTMEAGDLDATLRAVSGFSRDQLQIMEREENTNHRYECVWAAAGEGEDQVGRAVILDDGNYHYIISVMAGASVAGDLTAQWQKLVDSVSLGTG